jgi:outer membrane protein OmpA-like peptidoglycan-associated protein
MLKNLILPFLCLYTSEVFGQSLVRNGDFEGHTPFEEGYSPFYWGIDHLWNWSNSGSSLISYCQMDLEIRTDTLFKRTSCCGNTIFPHSGKGMVKLGYCENCENPNIGMEGCATYLHTQLNEPLEVGSVYEIRIWFYLPKDLGEDPELLTNIGFFLTLKPEHIDVETMIKSDYFFSDTLPKGEWFELKKYIRALCPLQHLTIGAFMDADFPSIHRWIDNDYPYFVDDVSVLKIPEEEVPPSVSPTPFCNYFERRKKEEEIRKVDQVHIYFQSDESTLDAKDMARLDSFYQSKEGNKGRAFVLSGYTDNEGNDNLRLSNDRVRSVRQYYDSTYQLADEMLICFAKGVDTTGNNRTEGGKQKNRRVTVQNSNITAIQALYRKALAYTAQYQVPEAARTFKAWIQVASQDQVMAVLHDPRLETLKRLPVWSFLTAEVKKRYAYYGQPRNAYFLDSLYFEDQKYRTFIPVYLTGYIEGLDTFDFSDLNLDWDQVEIFDSINHVTALKYLQKNSLPKISQVGRRQAKTIVWILLHNSDTTLIEKYLPILKSHCLEGEAEWDVYANMFDKLQLFRNEPQHYGMQWVYVDPEHTQLTYYKLDSLDAVNARRRSIGLSMITDPNEIVRVRKYKPKKKV